MLVVASSSVELIVYRSGRKHGLRLIWLSVLVWSLFDGVNSNNKRCRVTPRLVIGFPPTPSIPYPHIWEFPPERLVLLDGLNKFKTFPDKADTLLFKPSRNYSIHFFNGETQPLQTGCAYVQKFIKKKTAMLNAYCFLFFTSYTANNV